MSFLPDNNDPAQGNQILRAGAGLAYRQKAYGIPPANVNVNINYPDVPAIFVTISPTLNGDWYLKGTLSVTGIIASGSRLIEIPRKLSLPEEYIIEENASGTKTIGLVIQGAVHSTAVIQIGLSVVSGNFIGLDYLEGPVLASGNTIILDNIIIRPLLPTL